MKTSTLVWGIIALLVILGLGWWFLAGQPQTSSTNTTQTNAMGSDQGASPATSTTTVATSTTSITATSTAPKTVTVTYGPHGFSPATVTVAKGDTVTFVNQGTGRMWVASDPHPTHQGYDGTTRSQHCIAGYKGPKPFDECTAANTFSFTFNKTGSFGYHNHAADQDKGTVVVR